jgi:Zn-dependent protease with chaperone function
VVIWFGAPTQADTWPQGRHRLRRVLLSQLLFPIITGAIGQVIGSVAMEQIQPRHRGRDSAGTQRAEYLTSDQAQDLRDKCQKLARATLPPAEAARLADAILSTLCSGQWRVMTMSATPRPAPASSTGQPPSKPAPLLGLYALVFTVLGCIGAFAGEIFFLGDRALSAGHVRTIARCLQAPTMHSPLSLPAFDRCVSGSFRLEGLFVLAVAVAVPALTAMLSLIAPWMTQQRLARSGGFNIPAAATRFEELCDQAGLAGRRRPRLFIGGLGQREAYTTGLPRRRSLIVISSKMAGFAASDPSRFDPVVLHEMAHVRARDVSWVSSVRHITWITLPVVVLACIAQVFDADGGQFFTIVTIVLQAAVFVAGSVLIARELLRRREIEADRQAAWWLGSPEPLRRLLETGRRAVPIKPGGAGHWWSLPLARHPSPAARIAALHDPLGRQDGGFVYTLVAGVVAVMAMNTSYFLT